MHVTKVKFLKNLMPFVSEITFMAAPFIVLKPFRDDTGRYFASVAIRCVVYGYNDFRTAVWATSVRWVTTSSVLRFALRPSKLLLGFLELII